VPDKQYISYTGFQGRPRQNFGLFNWNNIEK